MISPYKKSFREGIKPNPYMHVWQWANKFRSMSPKTSPIPGPFRTSLTPYLRKPMESLGPESPVCMVVLKFPAQVGKSEVGINWTGFVADYSPAPMMIVQPTIETAQDFSKRRIQDLISGTPSLAKKMRDGKSKDGSNTIRAKDFPGGFLLLAGANSSASLASNPIMYLFLDEVDRYPIELAGEGCPIKLALARLSAFASSKCLMTSTPTDGTSRVEQYYRDGNQQKYHVPCPDCGWKQELVIDNLSWLDGKPVYQCEDCGSCFGEHHKAWFLYEENGAEWVAQNADATYESYHINALYAPLGFKTTWDSLLIEKEAAEKNPEFMKSFVNLKLAEPYSHGGDILDYEKYYLRAEDYDQGTIPDGHYVLTAAVDVQQDRLEVTVTGWGRDMRNAVVLYRSIAGAPSQSEVWDELDNILNTEYQHEAGGSARIRLMFVDAGYSAQNVYQYCLRHSPTKVMAIRGRDNLQTALIPPKRIDYKKNGIVMFAGVTIQNIGVNILKEEIYNWLKAPLPEDGQRLPRGWSRWPALGMDYFKGLCSEQLVSKIVRGRQSYAWEKIQGRERNEPLDLAVYNLAAATSLGVYQWDDKRWQLEESNIRQSVMSHTERVNHSTQNRARPRQHKSSWLDR